MRLHVQFYHPRGWTSAIFGASRWVNVTSTEAQSPARPCSIQRDIGGDDGRDTHTFEKSITVGSGRKEIYEKRPRERMTWLKDQAEIDLLRAFYIKAVEPLNAPSTLMLQKETTDLITH